MIWSFATVLLLLGIEKKVIIEAQQIHMILVLFDNDLRNFGKFRIGALEFKL